MNAGGGSHRSRERGERLGRWAADRG
jgi:hypothetical protein